MKVLRAAGRGMAALLGAGFVSAAYIYLTLPDVRPLRTGDPSTTAFMELRAREAHARGLPVERDWRWIPYARISPHLKRAVIVTEDDACGECLVPRTIMEPMVAKMLRDGGVDAAVGQRERDRRECRER